MFLSKILTDKTIINWNYWQKTNRKLCHQPESEIPKIYIVIKNTHRLDQKHFARQSIINWYNFTKWQMSLGKKALYKLTKKKKKTCRYKHKHSRKLINSLFFALFNCKHVFKLLTQWLLLSRQFIWLLKHRCRNIDYLAHRYIVFNWLKGVFITALALFVSFQFHVINWKIACGYMEHNIELFSSGIYWLLRKVDFIPIPIMFFLFLFEVDVIVTVARIRDDFCFINDSKIQYTYIHIENSTNPFTAFSFKR